MKTAIRIALVAVMLAAVSLSAEEMPKTAAGKALAGWVDSYNKDDLEARKAYLKQNTSLSQESIDKYAPMDIELRGSYGKFRLAKVVSSDETNIVALLQHGESGPKARVEIVADEAGKIEKISLRGEG